jgi:uncharacterized protein YjbJ (UPF0337 family)
MNKDQVEGKVKDVAGRVQRQVGEWTGDTDAQVKGTAKQAEGKVQNAWGDVKDASQKAVDNAKQKTSERDDVEAEQAERDRQRKAS